MTDSIGAIVAGVRQHIQAKYPSARFAWFMPPMVDEALRLGVEYGGQRYYTIVTDDDFRLDIDQLIVTLCMRLDSLIAAKEAHDEA